MTYTHILAVSRHSEEITYILKHRTRIQQNLIIFAFDYQILEVMETKPNYKSIYEILKKDVLDGVYPTGSLLPTELTLANQYAVSRPTIAKVYNQLQEEGYITKKKGLGTIVNHKHTSNTYTFGLLLPGAGESEIFSIINDQLLKQSETGKFNCLWEGATASNANIRRELVETCCDNYIKKGVDGIFFSPLERVVNADLINLRICEKIEKAGIPLILIDRDVFNFPQRSNFDVVCLDNFSAGCIMAQHLIDQGSTNIHFLYRPDSASSVNMRLVGVKETVQKNRLAFDEKHIHCGNPEDLNFVKQMQITPGKTGIICANDSTAAVLMSTLTDIGIQISSDLLICAYDNMKYSMHLKHSLTSFKQPCEEIANVSIELMFRRVNNKESYPVTVNLAGEIVIRDSSRFIV